MNFINREAEQQLISNAFRALHNHKEDLLLTPVLDFYGLDGIGKTAMLDLIEQQCREQAMACLRINSGPDAQQFSLAVIQQAEKYDVRINATYEDSDLWQKAVHVTKTLLAREATVMLIDAVDVRNEELIDRIATTLREVMEDNKLLVVLTSRRSLLFDNERAVARKMTAYQLKSFTRDNCDSYLDSIDSHLEGEVRTCIFDWTRGYPLAMQVMTQAIVKHHLDPRKPEDQPVILQYIVEEVINKRLLSRVKPQIFLHEYRTLLTLLSIPRRFNLTMMQDLIEEFEPSLSRDSSLAYMTIPRNINQATDILNWSLQKAGFSVEDPIRNVFLLKSRIEHLERYFAVHRFLARINKQLADDVQGTDRIRYLREYLYHYAHFEEPQKLAQALEQTVKEMTNEPSSSFDQFYEEFLQDEELKETLGEQKNLMLSLLYQHQAEVYRESAHQSTGIEQMRRIQDYLYYVMKDPQKTDLRLALQNSLQEFLAEEPADRAYQLANDLLHDDTTKQLFGKQYELLALLLQKYLASKE